MEMLIQGDKVFSVPASEFAISPSKQAYTLEYSANGEDFTAWKESTPTGENLVVTGAVKTMYYRLNGNADNLVLKYA